VVNAQCEGSVTLGRIRSVDGKAVTGLPSIRFQGESAMKGMSKGDGVVIETAQLVQKGNYLVAPSYKVVDKHISGKSFDLDAALASEETEKAPF